jgi:hypothetical protein
VKNRLLLQPVDFGGEHEIAFGQPIDLVSENCNLYPAPGEQEVRVMPLLFGNGPRAVNEIESGFEIREFENAMQVVFVHHFPAGQLGFQGFELRAL